MIGTIKNKDGSITKTIDGKFWFWIPQNQVEAYEKLNKDLNESFQKQVIWGNKK